MNKPSCANCSRMKGHNLPKIPGVCPFDHQRAAWIRVREMLAGRKCDWYVLFRKRDHACLSCELWLDGYEKCRMPKGCHGKVKACSDYRRFK